MITTPQQQAMFEATACDMLPFQPKPLEKNKSRIESISSITTESTTSSSTLCEEDHSIESDTDDTSNSSHQHNGDTTAMDLVPALAHTTLAEVSTAPSAVQLNSNTNNARNECNDDLEDEITTEDDIDMNHHGAPQQPQRDTSVNENSTQQSQDCRRSCIKDTSHESIPLRNHGWKNLPKLTIPDMTSKLVVSEQNKNNSSKSTSVVQFGTIEVRSYDVCIGDNPSVSYGTPISLDWDYVVELKDTVEKYESIRSLTKRRNMRQMMMNFNYRRNILLLHWNVTEEELLQAEKDMNIIRSQRGVTRALLPLAPLEDCMTSLYRKIQRRRNRACTLEQPQPHGQRHHKKLQHSRSSIVTN